MTELSLYVLDIVQNSVTAGADHITISLVQLGELLTFQVIDNGCGMTPEFAAKVQDPFTTTRTTRKVGLGLPFLKQLAEQTGGTLALESSLGEGTTLTCTFCPSHIDMVPLGDLSGTFVTLIQGAPQVRFTFVRALNSKEYTIDTEDMREILGEDVPLNAPDVLIWLMEYFTENELELQNTTSLEEE